MADGVWGKVGSCTTLDLELPEPRGMGFGGTGTGGRDGSWAKVVGWLLSIVAMSSPSGVSASVSTLDVAIAAGLVS